MRQVNENLRQKAVAARKAARLTQHKAAELVGVARATLARWETGRHWPGDFAIHSYISILEDLQK